MPQPSAMNTQRSTTDARPVAVLFTNGSPGSKIALEVGVELLVGIGWPVRLVGIDETGGKNQAYQLREGVAKTEARLRAAGLQVAVEVHQGRGPQIIAQQAAGATLSIFGPLGRSPLRRLLRGRTIREILQHVDGPILYVSAPARRPGFSRFLVCSGGLGHAETAVELAGRLAAGLKAELTLLHVSVPFPELPQPVRDIAAQEDEYLEADTIYARTLGRQLASLRERGIEPEFRLRRGDPLTEITAELRTRRYDLIAIGSHSVVGPVARLVGDITFRIAERAGIPVLVVKGPGAWANP